MPTLYKKITDRERLDFLLKHEAIPVFAPTGWQLGITKKSKAYIFNGGATPRIVIDKAFKALQGRKSYVYPTSDTAS